MLPKDFGPKGTFLGIVFTAGILALHAHALDPVLVMTRQQGGPRRHAPSTDVGGGKTHAVGSQGIDVRCLHPRIGLGVTAYGPMGVIIGVDEQDIRLGLRMGKGSQEKGEDKEWTIHGRVS